SDQGWLWISYEPWGWATYHYGRWVFDDYAGWVWIPGTTWAPAWVSWHESPDYIGWAPLPPDRGFFVEIGFVFNSYKSYYKPYRYHKHRYKKHKYYHDYYHDYGHYKPPARHCVYMPYHKFGDHKHAGKEALRPQDLIVVRNSRHVTNIKRYDNKVINHGPNRQKVERHLNKKLDRHKIVDKDLITVRGKKNLNYAKDKSYNVYRPKIDRQSKKPNRYNKSSLPNGYDRQTRVNQYPKSRADYGREIRQNNHNNRYKNKNRPQSGFRPEDAITTKKVQKNKVHNQKRNQLQNQNGRHKIDNRSDKRYKAKYEQKTRSSMNSSYKAKSKSNKKTYSSKQTRSYNKSRNYQQRTYNKPPRNIPTSRQNRFSHR
ncbi:MAG: DUF6600 domain-containing protein, partial [Thermodesulfobacteriota bacterium]